MPTAEQVTEINGNANLHGSTTHLNQRKLKERDRHSKEAERKTQLCLINRNKSYIRQIKHSARVDTYEFYSSAA